MDETIDERVLLEEAGQKISYIQAYKYCGTFLQELSLYDYMSIVKLKRKGMGTGACSEIQFNSTWVYSQIWVQALRKPGKHAVVCLDGYLSIDFSEEDDSCHRRYIYAIYNYCPIYRQQDT